MTAVNLNDLSASGPLEGFGQLTALTDLRLSYNRFSGARVPRVRAQAVALTPRPPASPWHAAQGQEGVSASEHCGGATRKHQVHVLHHHHLPDDDRAIPPVTLLSCRWLPPCPPHVSSCSQPGTSCSLKISEGMCAP